MTLAFSAAIFARGMGGRAVIPAAVLAIAAAMISKQVVSGWQRIELEGADPEVRAVVAEMVERYESET